jgi:OOP family OmpA-OmpF porin
MRKVLGLLSAILLSPVAAAQTSPGVYISGATGANFLETLQSSEATTRIGTEAGPMGLGAIGWSFGNGLRTEIEGSYRSSDLNGTSTRRVNGELLPLSETNGSAGIPAVMANAKYDLPDQQFALPVQPYIGGGVGYGWLNFDNAAGQGFAKFHLPRNNTFSGPDSVSFGNDGAFAYQAIVGASMPLGAVPNLDITFEYRFFGMASDIPVARVATDGFRVNGAIPSSVTRNSFEVHDHSIAIGLRYAFGAL